MPTEKLKSQGPLVSIICRSVGRNELKQALASAAAQTYQHVEIVLVQASQKSLSDFVSTVTNTPITLVALGKNLSRSDAANAGLDAAKGDYIMFLDDDDWIANDHVQHLVEYLQSHPKILAAYSSTQKTSFDGSVLKEVFSQDFNRQLLMHDNYIPIHSMLFSKGLLAKNCRFDNDFDIFEDWDFWLQLSLHTDFVHIDKLTAFYREGGESATASNNIEATERFSGNNPIAEGRVRLFSKWLKTWDGNAFNQLLGSIDKSGAIHKLNEALEARAQTITWQEQKIAERESKAAALTVEVTEKSRMLESLNSELGVALTKLHETNLDNAILAEENGKKARIMEALNTELGIAYAKLHEANLSNSNLSTEIQATEQTLFQLAQEISTLSEKINSLSDQVHHKEQELYAQSQHIEQLEQSVHTLLNSTSWRLMGPFRRIVRILRSLLISSQKKQPSSSIALEEPSSATMVITEGKSSQHNKPVNYALDTAAYANGCLYIRGWACGSPAIETITLLHDGIEIPVPTGGARDDIARAFPLISSAKNAGFSFFAEIAQAKTYELAFCDADGVREKISISPQTNLKLSEISDSGELYVLDPIDQYTIYRKLSRERQSHLKKDNPFDHEPLISIIVPVYNVKKGWLDACIESVLNQSYLNWELCLHDDGSSKQETLDCLKDWAKRDNRIKVQYGKDNQHISGASNSALEIASGEFIGLMDNDDELAIDALYWVVDAINSNPNADYLYTDEDKIDEQGNYCQPHFKPDWSPEMLESMMYVGHFGVIRRRIIDQVGGFRKGYEGSQDFDLTLRISQVTQNFIHIPKVLYHWRIIPGSVAGGSDQKSYAYTASFKALQDHVDKSANKGTVSTTATPGLYRVDRRLDNPRVAIIMPFHNKADMTIECLQSILKSSYSNYEVVLVSNNSEESEYQAVAKVVSTLRVATILKHDIEFNWSAINNWGAKQVDADFYLFLNNDMKVINEDWIEALLSCGCDEKVGAVGAKLLYEDDTVQHAGIVMHLGGVAGHPFKGLPADHPGYFGYAEITRNVAAVTGACLLVKNSVMALAEGFDESLGVAYNDVDFCLRLIELGYRNVYTPFSRLYHFESKTRPKTPDDMNTQQRLQFQQESDYIMQRHAKYFEEGDPYYNNALTLKLEDYSLKL